MKPVIIEPTEEKSRPECPPSFEVSVTQLGESTRALKMVEKVEVAQVDSTASPDSD